MTRLFTALALALALLCAPLPATAAAADPATLRVALLPDDNASTIIQNNQPLKHYLEQQLGKRIELVVTTDYSSMIEAMRFGRLELAYFGPLSYVLAKTKANIVPFAALVRDGSATYHTVVIGNVAGGINSLADVRGKDVAYGDPDSTSSHLIPKAMLLRAGLRSDRDYREHFVGSHDAVALTVQTGRAQAGGMSQPIFESMVARGLISTAKVHVIAVSAAYPQYPWTMRADLAPALQARIRKAFYDLKDKAVLKPFKAEGFAPMDDTAYDVVRDLQKTVGFEPGK